MAGVETDKRVETVETVENAGTPEAALRASHLTALDVAFAAYYLLLIICHLIASRQRIGWTSAALIDLLACGYLLGLAARPRWRPLIVRLMALGLVAGIAELATDAAGKGVAHSLIYPGREPMLVASPFYMPLSWMVVLVWIAYLAWRLATLASPPTVGVRVMIVGLVGALTVPFYEEMAYYAGWWRYVPAHSIGQVPIYVVVFEGAVAAILPLITSRLRECPLGYALAGGVIVGAWMPLAAFIAWFSLGR